MSACVSMRSPRGRRLPRRVGVLLPAVVLALLLGAGGGGQGAAPTWLAGLSPLTAAAAGTVSTYYLPNGAFAEDPSIAIDAHGGIHAAYSSRDATSIFYSYCAGNCGERTNWQSVKIGERGAALADAVLRLDGAGRPRVMWVYQGPSLGDLDEYKYGFCDRGCTDAANWGAVTASWAVTSYVAGNQWFNLDPDGRPRFVYRDNRDGWVGTFYAWCDADCHQAPSETGPWWATNVRGATTMDDLSNMHDLEFTAAGQPRLTLVAGPDDARAISFMQCDGNCDDSANWTGTAIGLEVGGVRARYVLGLDRQDRPRLILYTGFIATGHQDNNLLLYAWCDGGCASPDNWEGAWTGLPVEHGALVDMAFDAQNRPHLSYIAVDEAVHRVYEAVCAAGCTTDSPQWTATLLADTGDLMDYLTPPLDDGCTNQIWFLDTGSHTALALTGNGNPRVAYNAYVYQTGNLTCGTLGRYGIYHVWMSVADPDDGSGNGGGNDPTKPYRNYISLVRRP